MQRVKGPIKPEPPKPVNHRAVPNDREHTGMNKQDKRFLDSPRKGAI